MAPGVDLTTWWPAIAGAIIVVVLLAAVRAGSAAAQRAHTARDARRMFTAQERAAGFARANNQCEFARWVIFRCTRTASHGDHFIPWSQGGATSMANFVAACPTCNTTKGAHMPRRIDRVLMASRRRSYFPVSVPRAAGEWARR